MQLFQKLTITLLVGARVWYAAFLKFWFCVVDGKLHFYLINGHQMRTVKFGQGDGLGELVVPGLRRQLRRREKK
jgi:hypothetical protein